MQTFGWHIEHEVIDNIKTKEACLKLANKIIADFSGITHASCFEKG